MAAKEVARDKDYSQMVGLQEDFSELYKDVIKCFDDKESQKQNIQEYWDVYNCKLNEHQSYDGKSQVYIPIVRDAIEARQTSFVNQMFPKFGNHVEVVAEDPKNNLLALLENYIRQCNLRLLLPALCRSGDVEGQYTLYVEWLKDKREITRRVEKPVQVGEFENSAETVEDVEEEEIEFGRPKVSVISALDLGVVPATVSNIEEADMIVIALRMTKAAVKRKIKSGEFNKKIGEELLKNFAAARMDNRQPDSEKEKASYAGVKVEGGNKRALIYQVWTKRLDLGDYEGWSVTHFAGENMVLACKRNPYWNGKVPVISAPITRVAGSFWGKSKIEPVAPAQYAANDATNMGLDSAQYALLPIVMTDPEKNPRYASMVLSMAAIWQTNPNDTKFAEFPALWKDAVALVAELKAQIMQSLSTNPSMIPQGGANKKPSQAQVAQERLVALTSIADSVTIVEDSILTPLMRWFADLDHQYRDYPMIIKKYGELGVHAALESVGPIQSNEGVWFKWSGSEGFQSAQQTQQMIAGMNVLRGLAPQQLNGRKIDISPIVEHLVQSVYGSRMAARVLVDERDQMTIPPEIENQIMSAGYEAEVHPGDNDVAHIQAHIQGLREIAPQGNQAAMQAFIMHIQKTQAQLQQKAQAAAPAGLGSAPGGPAGAGPGQPGTPRIGAVPAAPGGGQNPPGTIHQDQLQDPNRMPRQAMQ